MKIFQTFVGLAFLVVLNGNVLAADVLPAGKAKEKALAGTGLTDPSIAGNLIQTTLGLLLVLAVIGAAAWAFKRFGNVQVGAQGRMKVIGGVSLGSRERAVLLQVGEEQIVVGIAPGHVQTLHVLTSPLVAEKSTESTSFSSRLQAAISKGKEKPNTEVEPGEGV